MKKFVFILLIISSFLTAGYTEENPLDSLYEIFPKMADLKGGDSRWIATGIVDKLHDDYASLSSTYNYFSEKSEKIWDIQRDKNYSVDIELHFAKNVQRAKKLYNNLLQGKKGKYQRDVKFGDEGRIFVKPISIKKLESEYNLYFRIQNFVVHLHTFDGFALMDFADFFQRKINNFVLKNIDMYLFKNFSFRVFKPGYIEFSDELTVETDNISSIKISGTVSDENGNVVKNATVDILGHDAYAKTDSNGHYSITFKIGKGEKLAEFKKNFTLTDRSGEDATEDVRIYKITAKYSNREENFYLRLNVDKKTGRIFLPEKEIFNQLKDITFDGNYTEFTRNCAPENSFFKCSQKFKGIFKNEEITGNWMGTGGKGSFKGELLNTVTKEYSLAGSDRCKMQTVEISENNTVTNSYPENFFIDNNHSLIVRCIFQDNFFTKSAVIHLIKKPSDVSVKLYKRTAELNENQLHYKSKTYLGLQEISDEPAHINIPVSAEEIKHYIIISGKKEKWHNRSLGFTGGPLYEGKQPVITINSFENGKNANQNITAKLISLSGDKDIAGPGEQLGGDGKRDIHIKLSISGIKGILKNIEIKNTGENSYSWNTKPFDVYPLIALLYNNTPLNEKNGKINFNIDKDMKIDIFIYKPEYLNQNNINLIYRLQIDDKWYKGDIAN